jgi:hypothetical protein
MTGGTPILYIENILKIPCPLIVEKHGEELKLHGLASADFRILSALRNKERR